MDYVPALGAGCSAGSFGAGDSSGRSAEATSVSGTLAAMPSLRHLVIFVLVLVVLRRFLAVPVSIAGSLVLTVVVSLIVSAIARDRS
jgi:hypothetical protein